MKSMEYKIAASTTLLSFTLSTFLHRLIVLQDCVFIKCKFYVRKDFSVLFTLGSSVPRRILGSQKVLGKYLSNKCNSGQLALEKFQDSTILWLPASVQQFFYNKTCHSQDFPGGPEVKDLLHNAEDKGIIPGWQTRIPHARSGGAHRPTCCSYWPAHHSR